MEFVTFPFQFLHSFSPKQNIQIPQIKGCQDHVINLMSKDYEAFLVQNTSPRLLVGAKHRVTDLVQMIVGRLRRTTRSFRCFMRREYHITKKLTIPRISDTRFVKTLFVIYELFVMKEKGLHGVILLLFLFGKIFISSYGFWLRRPFSLKLSCNVYFGFCIQKYVVCLPFAPFLHMHFYSPQ